MTASPVLCDRRPHLVRAALSLLAAVIFATPALAQLQNRTPTGGANITTRKCVGGANAGSLCNSDAQCDSNDCFDYNIVDLTVNFVLPGGGGWTPTAGQMATIQGLFTPISNTIADVTDGQMVLGTVALIVNNGAPNAVVQLAAGACNIGGGPCVTATDCPGGGCNGGGGLTGTGGWGATGRISVGIGCVQNPLCFAHEFMHLIANVRDEYEGALDDGFDNNGDGSIDECQENQSDRRCFGGTANGQPCQTCTGGPTPGAPCGTTFGCGAGGTCTQIACAGGGACRTITCIDPGPPAAPTSQPGCLMTCCLPNISSEICWAGNHDPNQDTEQDHCRANQSCWTRFATEWPSVIQVPPGGPVGGQVSPIAVGILTPSVLDRFVAIIDRSSSMALESPRRIDVAVTATRDFVDLLSNGTDFGLASFASADGGNPDGVDSTKDFPPEAGLRALNAASDRTAAKAAVDGLAGRTGGFTRIGAGLRQARDMLLEAGGVVTLNTTVLLLTDGINNRPEGSAQADLDGAVQELADASIPVFVSCIGQARDSAQCSTIADQTAGRFVDSATTAQLYDALVEFAAAAQGQEITASQIGTPIAQGELSAPIPALIEEGVDFARFVLSWTKPASDLDLQLFRPDNTPVSAGDKIQASQGESYLVINPEAGVWTMRVLGTSVPDPEEFSARAIVDHTAINVAAGLARSTIQWPEGFVVGANPAMGVGIAGCETSVFVEKPDGTTETFSLRDDGRGADTQEEDGLYQEEFRNFTPGDGIYTFTVSVRCQAGIAHFHAHLDPGIGEFPAFPPIADFERVIRFSGMVSGVPANLPPTARICRDARVECEPGLARIILDGTCSSDPEGGALSYLWSSATCGVSNPTAAMPTALCPLGTNEVSLVVTDAGGAPSDAVVGRAVVAACRLNLKKVNLRRQKTGVTRPSGLVSVTGTFITQPGARLTAVDGITVGIEDGRGFAVSKTWPAAECRASDGKISCQSLDGLAVVKFRAFYATPDVYGYRVRFSRLATAPDYVFGGPARMTLSYPSSEADRVGMVVDCRETATGLRCRQY